LLELLGFEWIVVRVFFFFSQIEFSGKFEVLSSAIEEKAVGF
jgi:hypothetical protein